MCQNHSSSPDDTSHLPRRNFLKLVGAAAFGLSFADRALAAEPALPRPQNAITPDAALARLIKGNERYVAGVAKRQDFSTDRQAMTTAQNPFAGVLSCADSRVAPEYTFDAGRGDLFVCRVAGNFAEPSSIANFEYGLAVLGVPLILVLGHQNCGAVSSTISAVKEGTEFPGHIPTLIDAIRPAVETSMKESGDLLDNSIKNNVLRNVEALKTASPLLDKAVKAGTLRIVGGIYDLDTGEVKILS